MTYSTLLEHNTKTLVLDTSVLLNLFSCNYGVRICKCLPNKILLSNIVLDEFWSRYEINEKKRFIENLDNENLIDRYSIDDIHMIRNFDELRKSGLGLGEIATIDIANIHKLIPVIDEKKLQKSQRINTDCRKLPVLPILSCTDLFIITLPMLNMLTPFFMLYIIVGCTLSMSYVTKLLILSGSKELIYALAYQNFDQ